MRLPPATPTSSTSPSPRSEASTCTPSSSSTAAIAKQLERLCKYVTRPPVAQERLEERADGRLELTLKNVWKDGTRALIFEPHDLLTGLVAAVPPPKFHLLRYFGVLSSHSALRAEVFPSRPRTRTNTGRQRARPINYPCSATVTATMKAQHAPHVRDGGGS